MLVWAVRGAAECGRRVRRSEQAAARTTTSKKEKKEKRSGVPRVSGGAPPQADGAVFAVSLSSRLLHCLRAVCALGPFSSFLRLRHTHRHGSPYVARPPRPPCPRLSCGTADGPSLVLFSTRRGAVHARGQRPADSGGHPQEVPEPRGGCVRTPPQSHRTRRAAATWPQPVPPRHLAAAAPAHSPPDSPGGRRCSPPCALFFSLFRLLLLCWVALCRRVLSWPRRAVRSRSRTTSCTTSGSFGGTPTPRRSCQRCVRPSLHSSSSSSSSSSNTQSRSGSSKSWPRQP